MKQALLVHGSKQTPVSVEETDGGGLIVWLNNVQLFKLQPVELAPAVTYPNLAAIQNRIPMLGDLNGSPAHDWTIFVRRFQKLPDVLAAVAHYYKNNVGYTVPSIDAMARANEDLAALQSALPEIITPEGELKYRGRAIIGRKLGLKDAGAGSKRIDIVVSLLLGNYAAFIEESGALVEVSGPKVEVSSQKAAKTATSTPFQKPPKAVNL